MKKFSSKNINVKNTEKMTALYAKQKAPSIHSGLFLRKDITDDNATRTAQIFLKLLQFD